MRIPKTLPALLPALLLAGCASLATQRMAGHLETAILDQDDPETVRAAAPAFLLLTESMIAEQPQDPGLLAAGSQLAAAYAALLEDPQRRERLETRSYDYATRALCAESTAVCQARDGSYEDFTAAVDRVGAGGLEVLYVYGAAWAAWMQRNAADWAAVADLPKLEYLFDHILSIDPAYRKGRAQLYAGALAALRPPALGGDPDKARAHFEAALQQSQRRDLIVQVEYARRYARLMMDQALYERLLNEVLAADPKAPGLTLTNLLAQEEAARLLAENDFSS